MSIQDPDVADRHSYLQYSTIIEVIKLNLNITSEISRLQVSIPYTHIVSVLSVLYAVYWTGEACSVCCIGVAFVVSL